MYADFAYRNYERAAIGYPNVFTKPEDKTMTATLENKDSVNGQLLYIALELSNLTWRLGFSNGSKTRQVTIESGNWLAFDQAVESTKERFYLPVTCPTYSCYEAGRDGFWIHRELSAKGINNRVIDSSSIEVNRRKRRVKSDSVDVKAMLRLLQRYWGGEQDVMRVIRIPTESEEDQRRLHRERGRLLKERGAHSARIQSLLVLHGIRMTVNKSFINELSQYACLGEDLKTELLREYARYDLVDEQIRALELDQKQRAKQADSLALEQINQLMLLKGVGWQSSWVLIMEFFSWRDFKNRREVGACAGLTPTPYDSGDSQREQGISKAGNKRVRTLMVELSWLWLRYQPQSALSQWFEKRFGHGGKRMRRIGIVAMARKLLIALWRYLRDGVIPEGAELTA
jgi:transposase